MACRINSVLLLVTVVFASNDLYGKCYGSDSLIEDGTYETCSECCYEIGFTEYTGACACGIDFLSHCLAFCNGFTEDEIEEGTCDKNLCEQSDCDGENGFCNWYKHPVSPDPPCDKTDDGVFCVKPSLLRGCVEHITDSQVCGYGLKRDMTFPNACFARAAGYTNYDEGPCTSEYALDAMTSLSIFGDSPGSQGISLKSSNAYGTFIPPYNQSTEEPDCDCPYNWEPVCLRTGLISFTFMNDCLAECRKNEQSVAYNQVYWPKTAYIVDGECPEPCIGKVCDEGMQCASWGEEHNTCVAEDQELCQDLCFDKYQEEKICVRQWLGFNDESWFLRNKCHAIQCLGIPKIHRYDKGDCQDQCINEVCTEEDKETDVCVFPEALGIRETVSRCKAKCKPSHWSAYIEGACDNTNCTKSCPVENNPICVNGKQFMSPCEANCEFNLDVDNADDLDISDEPFCQKEYSCSEDDDECCDKIPEDEPVSKFGFCHEYAPGKKHATYCNSDSITELHVNKKDFTESTTVAEACPYSCGVCGAPPTSAPAEPDCNDDGTCCNLIPDVVDGKDNKASNFGACAIYHTADKGGKYNKYCKSDKMRDSFSDESWWSSLKDSSDEVSVYQVCKYSCNNCEDEEPGEPEPAPGEENCDGDCCEPKNVEVTSYGNCDSYSEGKTNANYCSDKVIEEFQNDDGTATVTDVCKVACGNCAGADEVEECVDKKGSTYGPCSTYEEGFANHDYCEQDGMKTYAHCPVACKLDACVSDKGDDTSGVADCVDNPKADAGFGGCSTYVKGKPNHKHCAGDKMNVQGKCPIACLNEACDDGSDDGPCADMTGSVSDYGKCDSYASGKSNHKFCDKDDYINDKTKKIEEVCPTACATPSCSGDDDTAATTTPPLEGLCDPSNALCCDLPLQKESATQYGKCASYAPGGSNADYCSDDAGLKNSEWEGIPVGSLCKYSCQNCAGN